MDGYIEIAQVVGAKSGKWCDSHVVCSMFSILVLFLVRAYDDTFDPVVRTAAPLVRFSPPSSPPCLQLYSDCELRRCRLSFKPLSFPTCWGLGSCGSVAEPVWVGDPAVATVRIRWVARHAGGTQTALAPLMPLLHGPQLELPCNNPRHVKRQHVVVRRASIAEPVWPGDPAVSTVRLVWAGRYAGGAQTALAPLLPLLHSSILHYNSEIPILQYERMVLINGWCEELRSVTPSRFPA